MRLTLQGRYGARTTADTDGDPLTSVMFVAAPIRDRASGQIIGAVSVGKPVQSFGQFVEAVRRKTGLVGATPRDPRRSGPRLRETTPPQAPLHRHRAFAGAAKAGQGRR